MEIGYQFQACMFQHKVDMFMAHKLTLCSFLPYVTMSHTA